MVFTSTSTSIRRKTANGSFKEEESTHAAVENNYYKLEKWAIGEGEWKVIVVFPGFGEDLKSESGEKEFTIQAIPTETFLTLDKYANGTPGTASVSGNVFHNGSPIAGTVNVNFQKLVGGTWQTMSTAQRTLSNGHYEVLNWGVGVDNGAYARSSRIKMNMASQNRRITNSLFSQSHRKRSLRSITTTTVPRERLASPAMCCTMALV